MKRKIFLLLLIAFTVNGFAQYKYEKEIRIKKRDAPESALNFVDSMHFDARIRWYKEIGYNKISLEAKTKYKGKRYSIEFSEDGFFEDVEVEIRSNEIPDTTYSEITKFLSSEHLNYSIEKVQIQYSGKTSQVLAYFQNQDTADNLMVHYEVKISAKMEGSFARFEYLFSENGECVGKLRIVLNNTDNIIY